MGELPPRPSPAAPTRSSWRDRRRERVAQLRITGGGLHRRPRPALRSRPIGARSTRTNMSKPTLRRPGRPCITTLIKLRRPITSTGRTQSCRNPHLRRVAGSSLRCSVALLLSRPWTEHQAWQWPDALPGVAVESPRAIEHHGEPWDVPALPAPDAAEIGWDASEAAWSELEPSYAALSAPEVEQLSTQAEIDRFIEAAWETAPVIEAETKPDYDLPALPPSQESTDA